MNKIFIYGTLAPGKPNEHILSDLKGSWEDAYVYGSLLKEGWGSDLGFPGIVLDNQKDIVDGFIFTSSELKNKLTFLDQFEGIEYKRVTTIAYLKSGEECEVYIYVLNRK
ncbi:gamma-glutamylcyclotransferase [Malaciobacter halophilus]|uniref:gamma-glutamylcyclotransferase family protein n=1 Tax=Malaciobacter marinus TaxID=505249 RepID=UPI000C08258A|nr:MULTISPECIES: gamma-glutamylcyclotransferase family protein [Malaciobacter]PHO12196.1 hypothetical protein CPG38_09175 [Malaciobacter marinus]RYA24862.1 gamma-glutamylcyclotransferase [Malaciobacter halophilus]